ncbi:hypothetical protein I79_001168 [Cricetulus griseus]|uniref:Uncharacterized protein n=1 Tax=Cricetulus griseus TaxID=10029 RepID=G3GU21_CRIGR|nr:hypothetical protein I79_001168 [Cricetulus griseus]
MALPWGLDFVTYIYRVFSLDDQNQINCQANQWLKETQADPLLDYSLDFTLPHSSSEFKPTFGNSYQWSLLLFYYSADRSEILKPGAIQGARILSALFIPPFPIL